MVPLKMWVWITVGHLEGLLVSDLGACFWLERAKSQQSGGGEAMARAQKTPVGLRPGVVRYRRQRR
jgi:hypothetical protein